MGILDELQTAPVAFDPDRGDALAAVWDTQGQLRKVIHGIGGCSPYLSRVLEQYQKEIADLLLLTDPVGAVMESVDIADPHQSFRRAKAQIAGLLAIADCGGAWPLEKVTQELTRFADFATETAFNATLAPLIKRGKIPGDHGLFVIAMGKMGAGELNYSSDIDLIVMFNDQGLDPQDRAERRSHLVRATKNACLLLSKSDADGYVFRTDLRLRPDPSVTPVCVASSMAEQYYESLGRTWERAAFIKARICAGDIGAGNEFLQTLTPFVWRKFLDYAAIEEAHDLRKKLRDHKGLQGRIQIEGHDLKLGRGGIREIEFFTQTRQLISAGRDPALRGRETVPALQALASAGWVDEADAAALIDHYRYFRTVEHRLQMLRDAQTHSLPHSAEGLTTIAMFMAEAPDAFETNILTRLEAVQKITEPFFKPRHAAIMNDEIAFDDSLTTAWPGYPALRSERAQALFDRIKPQILIKLQSHPYPDEALRHFDGFLSRLPAGVQVFSLFASNPKLLDLVVDVIGAAPELADYLARNPGVMDAVISGDFFAPWDGPGGIGDAPHRVLSPVDDYESVLLATRRWMKELHFRIGVQFLLGIMPADQAGRAYADLAQVVVQGLLPHVAKEFARKYGGIQNGKMIIVGMGSLGAGVLTARSDLDLMLIFDAPADAVSDGKRELSARQYYAKLTQMLITALSAPMGEGILYEVDMRLRPSGRNGPVATGFQGFQSYQRDEAWTWEHLALTRARAIAGDASLCAEFEQARQEILTEKATGSNAKSDVAEMISRLRDAKPATGMLDLKSGPGGLQEMELFTQYQQLTRAKGPNPFDQTMRVFGDLRLASSILIRSLAATDRLSTRGWDIIGEILNKQTSAEIEAEIAHLRQMSQNALDDFFFNAKS